MKKITSVLTLVCALFILMAGCENAALPDPVAAINEELSAADGRAVSLTGWNGATITGVTVGGTIYNINGAEFTLTFTPATGSFSPDKEALQSAITIWDLGELSLPVTSTSVTDSRPYPRVGSAITAEVLHVDGKEARIKANLSALTHDTIEIYIDAGKFTANGGRIKLNADGDLTPGEPEDDIYKYPSVTTAQPSATSLPAPTGGGVQRNPMMAVILSAPAFSASQSPGLGVSGLIDEYEFTIANYADTEDANIKDFFKKNLKIDKFVNGTWSLGAVTVTGVDTNALGRSRLYTAALSGVQDRDILRARLENVRDFVTTNEYYGFRQKLSFGIADYAYKDDDPEAYLISDPTYTTDKSTNASGSVARYTAGSIASDPAELVSKDSRSVYVRIPLITGNLDGATPAPVVGAGELRDVNPNTVKIVAQHSSGTYVNIDWENSSYEYKVQLVTPAVGDPTSTRVPEALLLKLPDSFKKSDRTWKVYITPGVTTSSGKAAEPEGIYFFPGIYTGIADEVTGSGNL
jgi:hypothetical protein